MDHHSRHAIWAFWRQPAQHRDDATTRTPRHLRTARQAVVLLGAIVALGATPACDGGGDEIGVADQRATSGLPEVSVSPIPCLGCAEHVQEIASAQAQAAAVAMQQAEARARELRRLAAAKIQACVTKKNQAVNNCNRGIQADAARAAAARAICNVQPVCAGSDSTAQKNACTSLGSVSCTDQLNSCVNLIPIGAPGIEASVIQGAVLECNRNFGQPCVDEARRECGGIGNFGGFGTTQARCQGFQHENCAEPEARAVAGAMQTLAQCLSTAQAIESLCLGNPTAVMM